MQMKDIQGEGPLPLCVNEQVIFIRLCWLRPHTAMTPEPDPTSTYNGFYPHHMIMIISSKPVGGWKTTVLF